MKKKLPVIISIPHGGIEIPQEVQHLTGIDKADIFDDTDAFTNEIYDMSNRAEYFFCTHIARTFIDLNRNPLQLPPAFPDGVIKSITCYEKTVYLNKRIPDKKTIALLLQKYYNPYHDNLTRASCSGKASIGLDCHSMAETGPPLSPDQGKIRPLINIGNAGGLSANFGLALSLAECFTEIFRFRPEEVTINKPFQGGYITRNYGNRPLPWLQIEMNRKLYLESPFFNRNSLSVDKSRIDELNRLFKLVIEKFCHKSLKNLHLKVA